MSIDMTTIERTNTTPSAHYHPPISTSPSFYQSYSAGYEYSRFLYRIHLVPPFEWWEA